MCVLVHLNTKHQTHWTGSAQNPLEPDKKDLENSSALRYISLKCPVCSPCSPQHHLKAHIKPRGKNYFPYTGHTLPSIAADYRRSSLYATIIIISCSERQFLIFNQLKENMIVEKIIITIFKIIILK